MGEISAHARKNRMFTQQLKYRLAQLTLGKSITSIIIAQEGDISFKRYRKTRARIKMLNKEFKKSKSYMTNLIDICLGSLSPVTSPIALISQIQRSGGTLLSQLFDGHPELHAHPHELMIGYPKKHIWPTVDLDDTPERWFEILFEDTVIAHFQSGYKKMDQYEEEFPFIFLPSLQRKIFLKYIDSVESIKLRDVFNAYMTSYFGAWLNNQNSFAMKKFVTGFTPRLAMVRDSIRSFFEIYPDGRLISVVRDPKNWYPSAYRHNAVIKKKKYENIRQAMDQWNENAQSMVWNAEMYGDRVCTVRFEDLISDTESVMRYMADFLDVEFDDILLEPTFNRFPIKANTSFQIEKHGIINSTLSRYKTLKEEDLEIIEEMTKETYPTVLQRVVKFQ
jgi:hypothetical protein